MKKTDESGLIAYNILHFLNAKTSVSEEELINALAEKGFSNHEVTKAVLLKLMAEKLVIMDSHLFAEPPYNASYILTTAGENLAKKTKSMKKLSQNIINHALEDLAKCQNQLNTMRQALLAIKLNLDSE
ncbi:MAG: hypothetical protein PHW50_01030 [Patescibacteria group bacterium]|nr:hypothetical protein [Patescibacteria group bacterium]